MSETIGLRDLRHHTRAVLNRVRDGERLIVTDRNKPIAQLVPYVEPGSALERLIANGVVRPPRRPLVIDPIPLEPGDMTLSEALEEVRAERDI